MTTVGDDSAALAAWLQRNANPTASPQPQGAQAIGQNAARQHLEQRPDVFTSRSGREARAKWANRIPGYDQMTPDQRSEALKGFREEMVSHRAAQSAAVQQPGLFSRIGNKIKGAAKWATASGAYKNTTGAQIARWGGMAAGGVAGGAAGYGAAHLAVEKTPLADKMSEGAKLATKRVTAAVTGTGGAITVTKLLPKIFKNLAARV